MSTFSLNLSLDKKKLVFRNSLPKFVELLIDVNGIDARFGKPFTLSRRGYAIPPEMEKNISKLKDGTSLPFKNNGTISAYIFDGSVRYRDEDIDLPAFLRSKVVRKVRFSRSSDKPIEVLKLSY